jgi:ADP-heptose:LPS heptosyltransferase
LSVINDEAGLDYFIPDHDLINEADIPAGHLAGYIAVVIGATYNTKKLPVNKLRELCDGIQHPLILIGGPDDRESGEQIAAADRHRIYNACGKFNLNESADLIRRSKFVISHDTGFMHVATALKKQVISVWGNTVPDFGMYPYYGDNFQKQYAGNDADKSPYEIVEVDGLACRPCSKIGYGKCPLGHFRCMNNIDIPYIIGQVNLRLGKR